MVSKETLFRIIHMVVENMWIRAVLPKRKICKGGSDMESAKGMSAERMADLERRVQALEERTRNAIWGESPITLRREEKLVERYGESVDKTVAARMLGVTRATVYAMLSDGRILGACEGRRVDVRSIARYLSQSAQRCTIN